MLVTGGRDLTDVPSAYDVGEAAHPVTVDDPSDAAEFVASMSGIIDLF